MRRRKLPATLRAIIVRQGRLRRYRSQIAQMADREGKLPAWAWPGGYPVFYVGEVGRAQRVLCPACASSPNELETDETIVASDCNWEDPDLSCDACGERIESAYAEDEAEATS